MAGDLDKKIRVGLIFGGQSSEHEVSLQSAKNIYEAVDREKFEVQLIGVTKEGIWLDYTSSEFLINKDDPNTISLAKTEESFPTDRKNLNSKMVDVFFPIIHGINGEDGSLQGLLQLMNQQYVGADVLGSAIAMDKDVAKKLLQSGGVKVVPWVCLKKGHSNHQTKITRAISDYGFPLFVKPSAQGSSVGVSKAKNEKELKEAIDAAFQHDSKVMVEQAIEGRELECALIGNEQLRCSRVGEIVSNHEFYSYEAKYIDENGADLKAPADIDSKTEDAIQKIAVEAFHCLDCRDLARVDVFLTKEGEIFVNEINTLPGFTRISMYPKLWEVSGLSYTELITELIELAQSRNRAEIATDSTFY